MAICPIICSIYYLARALVHDVACEFACAVGCAETISANVLNTFQESYIFAGISGKSVDGFAFANLEYCIHTVTVDNLQVWVCGY